MNPIEIAGLFSGADDVLAQYIEKLPARQKKTAKSFLESVVKLAYVLFATGDVERAGQVANAVSEIPFSNSYDYWTWIEAALVLKGKLALEAGSTNVYEAARQSAAAALESGTELQITVKANVQKRFMEGQTLDNGFDQEEDVVDEFDMRIVYIMALMKIAFFGGSEKWPVGKIDDEVMASVERIKEITAAKGLYKLPPYK